jgi:hypothetical protein
MPLGDLPEGQAALMDVSVVEGMIEVSERLVTLQNFAP